MRVFVFGTGRCGTVTIARALAHACNYTCEHESNCALLEYPDNHIEVNPQLRIRGRELAEKYPDAIYAWLQRDREKVEASYARLDHGRWLNMWWSFHNTLRPPNVSAAARIAVAWMLEACEQLYRMAPEANRIVMSIGGPARENEFRSLWDRIGAEGDLDAALAEYQVRHNSSEERGDA